MSIQPRNHRDDTIVYVPEEEPPEEERGCSGCLWGLGGALGCLAMLLLPLVLAIVLGLTTATTLIDGVRYIFNTSEPVYNFNTNTVLERVQNMSQLTTTRYNYSSIVTSERELPGILASLYGERLVMVAAGHVTAGIDMSRLDRDAVKVSNNTLTIRLPPPELLECFLNESQSYVISRETGLFAAPAPQLGTEARRFALRQFRDFALEDDILSAAQEQATAAVREFLLLGLPEDTVVEIQTTPPDEADTPQAESCR